VNSSQTSIARELSAAGAKASGTYNDVRFGPFTFNVLLTDNATTSVDLRSATAITDAQLDQLGATSDNPPIYMIVTGYRLSFPASGELPDIIRQIKSSVYLYHEPTKGPNRQMMLASAGTIATQAVAASAAAVTSAPASIVTFKNPMLIAFRRETFEVRYQTAVNTGGGNLTGVLELFGYAMPDDVPLSPVSVDCVSEADAKQIGRQGIPGVNQI